MEVILNRFHRWIYKEGGFGQMAEKKIIQRQYNSILSDKDRMN